MKLLGGSICPPCFTLKKSFLKPIKELLHEKQKKGVKLHRNALKHGCPQTDCDETLPCRVTLSQHIKSDHVTLFKCDWQECCKHFGSQNALDTHMKRHLKEFSYFCTNCEKGFVTGKELKLHQIFHKDEKEFSCEICEKKFSRKQGLITHMTLHTGICRLNNVVLSFKI